MLPDVCGTCQQIYSTGSDDQSPVHCLMCKRSVHIDCYVARTGSNNPLPKLQGLHWFCPNCETNLQHFLTTDIDETPEPTQSSPSDEPIPETTKPKQPNPISDDPQNNETHTTHDEDRHANEANADHQRNNSTSQTPPICKFFKNNRCKHGIAGTGCRFTHPKPCSKFLQNGNNHRTGCRKGNNCTFFHPKICHTSLNTRECFNENCQYTHIKGTKRTKPIPSLMSDETRYDAEFPPLPIYQRTNQPNMLHPQSMANNICTQTTNNQNTNQNYKPQQYPENRQNQAQTSAPPPQQNQYQPSSADNNFLAILQQIQTRLKEIENAQVGQTHIINTLMSHNQATVTPHPIPTQNQALYQQQQIIQQGQLQYQHQQQNQQQQHQQQHQQSHHMNQNKVSGAQT